MVRIAISSLARCGIGLFLLSACVCSSDAQVAKWEASFPSASGGQVVKSIATPLDEGGLLVAVVLPGAEAMRPTVTRAGQPVSVEVVGMDSVSRLCFLKASAAGDRLAWGKTAPYTPGTPLQSPGPLKARATGWVKQIGTKVLPFALLRINFEGAVPPTGSSGQHRGWPGGRGGIPIRRERQCLRHSRGGGPTGEDGRLRQRQAGAWLAGVIVAGGVSFSPGHAGQPGFSRVESWHPPQ
ncbi:MAG: hypothetical protein QM755_09080 [Luteolibacter sp.]